MNTLCWKEKVLTDSPVLHHVRLGITSWLRGISRPVRRDGALLLAVLELASNFLPAFEATPASVPLPPNEAASDSPQHSRRLAGP